MRRLLLGTVVAAAAALVPTWAMAGNQDVAEKIAANLRESGQLDGYRIGVKVQDGTAWLRGRVSSREQMNAALKLVVRSAGVTRVINDLQIGVGEQPAAPVADLPKASARPAPPNLSRKTVPLKQVAGALAPERLSQHVADDLAVTTAQQAPRESHAASKLQQVVSSAMKALKKKVVEPLEEPAPEPAPKQNEAQADRVATSFTPSTARQATATAVQEGPTLAPPRMAAHPKTLVEAVRKTTGWSGPQQVPAGRVHQMSGMAIRQAPPMAVMATQSAPIAAAQRGAPLPIGAAVGAPVPQYVMPTSGGVAPARYDQPHLPNYAWPSYAAHPNYAGLTYPKQHSPTAWPYIGPFYPYPQVPLGWRKVTLEWHDGWWMLDFDSGARSHGLSGLFRPNR